MGWKQQRHFPSILKVSRIFDAMQDIAIVILNWNGKELLEKFLPSVCKHSENAQIYIADNASTDDSIKFIRDVYPSIQIIQNEQNFGFAKGYNEALKKIDSPFYLLLNNDVEVTSGWLNSLMGQMKNVNVAAVQPKILSHIKKNEFEHAGANGGFLDRDYFPFCRGRIFEVTEKDNHQYDTAMEVFWTSGAAMLIRSEVFHQVKGFDDDFFAHMEEIDLCWRIKKMGYQLMIEPKAVVYHLGGGTLSYSSPRKVFLNFRNNLSMICKNHEGPLFGKMFKRLSLDGVAAIRFLTKGEFNAFWAVLRSHVWFYAHLNSLIKKRKYVKQHSTTFNRSGLYNGSIIWMHYVKKVKFFSELNQRLFLK